MRAYFMDDHPGDRRLPHDSGREASDAVLKSIGVLHRHIPIDEMGTYKNEVLKVAKERDYKNHDAMVISKESLGDEFDTRIENFYHEHMHEDEEIRYLLEGSGYFDVRVTESWIRCYMSAGDLLVLPAGIYHRFSLDTENRVRTMRLFKDEPEWIAHNRGQETDVNPFRIEYLKSIEVQRPGTGVEEIVTLSSFSCVEPLLSLVSSVHTSSPEPSPKHGVGKHYMSTQSVVAPGGNFPLPSPSSDPLLALRCAPAIRPYLAEDVLSPASILIDAPVVYYEIANAEPIQLCSDDTMLDVTVSLDGRTLAAGLEGITPQNAAYNLSCEATYAATSQTFSATTALSVLPNPTNSSVTKMDLRTGALLAKPATGLGGTYEPVFPIGFYTIFDGYLATNLSVINGTERTGVHDLPTFDNLTALNLVIDRMQEVGLYLIQQRSNLALTSSFGTPETEPDGTSDPLNATTIAYDLIYSLDGYHPVSLVLNCQDYYWSSYTAGTDVVMQDVYMVGNNVTWSNEWNTTCTPDYGDCGCDNCVSIAAGDTAAVPPNSTYYGSGYVPANSGIGTYFDVSDRVASFKNRLEVMGWERTKAVWTVPQAFGGDGEYWLRAPTGEEWVVQSIMGINQGALGVVPWDDPTPADIKSSSSGFALSLPKMTPYLFNSASVRTAYVVGGASVATWKAGAQTLVLATNTDYVNQTVSWEALGLEAWVGATSVFASGVVETVQGGFMLGPVGSGAFVVAT
ncbi:ARD/ARD' family-domain-containing protein [Lanmaoa asiatica]|nr:ARD/ARD' family-domain-containing protein [Lanmaoa asiatica]